MTIAASVIFDKVKRILQDETNVRWTVADLVGWFNSAQREVALLKPDALSSNTSKQLAAGTKQSIPESGLRLLDVIRNLGTDGTTPGLAITGIPRKVLDTTLPDWHSSTPSAVAKRFVFDERDPLTFYVFPPQPATGQGYVELLISLAPTDITVVSNEPSGNLSLPDLYENAIIDHILYRAFSEDSGNPLGAQKAQMHYAAFATALGQKVQAERYYAPKRTATSDQQASQ